MFDESLAKGASLIHRLDPRFKIIAAAALSVVAALGRSYPAAAVALAVGVILIACARLPVRQLMGRVLTANGFIIAVGIILLFTYPGEPLMRIGALEVSRAGALLAGLILVKSNAVILLCIALVSTSTLVAMAHALWHLHVPNKIIQILFFTIRYFNVIHREYHRLSAAMRCRGFCPAMNMHTYRSYGNLVGMLLVKSYERSERIYKAMLCRGFKGRFYILSHFAATSSDYWFAAIMVPAVILIGLVQWTKIIL